MQHLALAAPLFLGSSIKIAYDLLLYAAFRALRPPEERAEAAPAISTAGHPSFGPFYTLISATKH